MTYTQTVIDPFSGTSLDTSRWTTPQGNGDITESSGTLKIHATSSYNEIRSVSSYDLSQGILAVQVSQTGTPTAYTEFYINVADASGNTIQLDQVVNGTYAEIDSGGTGVTHTGNSVTGDGVNPSWTAGTWIGVGNYNTSSKLLTWYTSSDGQTWTEIAHTTVSAGINFSAAKLSLVAGCYSGTTTWTVTLDNASYWSQSSGLGGTSYTYTQNVYDNFDDNSFDTGRWTDESETSASGRIAETGGTLQLKALSAEVEVDTTATFDLTSGLWGVEWSHTGSGTSSETGTECYFGFADADGNYFEIQTWPVNNSWYSWKSWDSGSDGRTDGTDIGPQNTFGSAWTAGDYIAFGNHNINSDNRMHIYKSSDLITWTEIASVVITGSMDMTAAAFFLGTYQISGSSTWISVFDDVSTFVRATGSGGSGGGSGGSGGSGEGSGTFTPTNVPLLGMYNTGGAFPTPGPDAWNSGSRTNISASYMAWGQDIPTYVESFVSKCNANGLTPFVELEAWNAGPSWNETPLFSDITAGTWDTWLEALGTYVASTGKPCIFTFAHEMNVSGQYPWSQGDSGSGPGGGTLTAAEWIAGWKYVHDKVNSTAGGLAYWMWACNSYTGGTTVSPAPWWPGASYVDMVGIDGYPNTEYGSTLGTFAGQIQPTVTIIRGLGWSKPIFLSETNLAQMVASGGQSITNFVNAFYAAGCSGVYEFEDAAWDLPVMSDAQWAEYNAAILANFGAGSGGSGGSGGGSSSYTTTLIDNFDDNSFNTSIWATPDGSSGVTETSGQLHIAGSTSYPQIIGGYEDLSAGFIGFQYYPSGTPSSAGSYLYLGVAPSNSNFGSIYVDVTSPSTYTAYGNGATTASDPSGDVTEITSGWTSGDWIGIGNIGSDNIVHLYKSADTETWTEIASFTVGGTFDRTNAALMISQGFDSGTSTFIVTIDNVTYFVPTGGGGSTTYTQTVIDNFDDDSFNTSLWSIAPWGSSGDITETSGKIQFQCNNHYTYAMADKSTSYDITAGFFAAQFSHTGTALTENFMFFGFESGTSNNTLAIEGFPYDEDWNGWASDVTLGSTTGDATAFGSEWTDGDWLGWGLIGDDNIMHVYKSSDAATWTEIATLAFSGTIDLTTTYIVIGCASSNTVTTTYKAQFDNASYFVPVESEGGSNSVKVRVSGAWVEAVPKVRVSGAWVEAVPKARVSGAWVTAS